MPASAAPDLFSRFAAAGQEGIGANYRRWLRLCGALPGEWSEIQVLDNGRGFAEMVDVDDETDAVRMIAEAERRARAVYLIANAINPVAVTRHRPKQWFSPKQKKKESITDRDITHRRVVYLDFDPERPTDTSATDDQVREALEVASRVVAFLRERAPVAEFALGFGMSGNGAALFLALDRLESTDELTSIVKEIIVAVQCRFETETVKVDRSVFDPKRLIPAWGSYKRKGADGFAERPHRRCALLVPDIVRRLTLAELGAVRDALVAELSPEQRAEVDRAAGRKAQAKSSQPAQSQPDDVFKRANEQPIREIAERLGLLDGDHVMCPGCREVGDSSVAFVGNGIKCFHNRCAGDGVRDGFRTAVDVVVTAKQCKPLEAVKQIFEWFGLEMPARQSQSQSQSQRPKPPPRPRVVPQPVTDADRLRIVIRTAEHEVEAEAISALARDPDLYQRAGAIAEVVGDKIHLLRNAQVRTRLSAAAQWVKIVDQNGAPTQIAAHPPDWAVNAVATNVRLRGIRPLNGIVTVPVLRPDGTILSEPGYDDTTGLLYQPAPELDGLTVPDDVTHADARDALTQLYSAVADFPFAEKMHRSAWLAGLLTMFARYAFDGPAPLFLVDSNTRGAGKGLLVDVAHMIATGHSAPVTALPERDEEVQKLITTRVLESAPVVLLDNISGDLGGPSLDMALTARVWSQRILGRSESVAMPMRITWWATGNNVQLKADTTRRILHVRLETPEENPEDRSGFRHPDLRAWLRRERRALIRAALTILRAFYSAGAPVAGLRGWGSFEEWSAVVRGAIAWLGEPDPVETRVAKAREADTEANMLHLAIEALREADPNGAGVKASDLARLASLPGNDSPLLKELIAEISPVRGNQTPSPKSIGRRLVSLKGRVCGEFKIDVYSDRKGIAHFLVKQVKK
jgi:hypothetical protein